MPDCDHRRLGCILDGRGATTASEHNAGRFPARLSAASQQHVSDERCEQVTWVIVSNEMCVNHEQVDCEILQMGWSGIPIETRSACVARIRDGVLPSITLKACIEEGAA